MRKALYLTIIILSAGFFNPPVSCGTTNVPSYLRNEAEQYLEAYMAKDYDTCLSMMGGSIVNALGGKITVLDNFRQTEEALRHRHLKLETMTVDEPRSIVSYGAKEQYVVIPERHIFIHKDGNKYVLNSYILAVSEDNGQTWSMLEGSWRISEHIKNHNLALYDRLKLPTRKVYPADDPNMYMVEKGGGFITPPETIAYKQKLRQRANPPPQPKRLGTR